VVSDKIQERIIKFEVGERVDSDNLLLECRTGSGVQKRTRRIEEDKSGKSRAKKET